PTVGPTVLAKLIRSRDVFFCSNPQKCESGNWPCVRKQKWGKAERGLGTRTTTPSTLLAASSRFAGRHHPADDLPGELFPLAGSTVRDRGRIELPFGRGKTS